LKTRSKPLVRAMTLVLATAALAPGARAADDERQSLEVLRQTTLNLIEALVEQGVFSRDKADAMVRAAEAKAATAVAAREPSRMSAPVAGSSGLLGWGVSWVSVCCVALMLCSIRRG